MGSDTGRTGAAGTATAEEELLRYRDKHATSSREKRTFDRLIGSERDRAEKLRRRFRNDWARFETESKKLKKLF